MSGQKQNNQGLKLGIQNVDSIIEQLDTEIKKLKIKKLAMYCAK